MTLAILCDACGSVISQRIDRLEARAARDTPPSLAYRFAHDEQADRSRHFCDYACLANWALKQSDPADHPTILEEP